MEFNQRFDAAPSMDHRVFRQIQGAIASVIRWHFMKQNLFVLISKSVSSWEGAKKGTLSDFISLERCLDIQKKWIWTCSIKMGMDSLIYRRDMGDSPSSNVCWDMSLKETYKSKKNGNTPLHEVALDGQWAMAQFIVLAGCRKDIRNKNGKKAGKVDQNADIRECIRISCQRSSR